MIFVDGGHTYEVASKDIKNMRHLAYDEHSNKTSIVIVDDLNIIEVSIHTYLFIYICIVYL